MKDFKDPEGATPLDPDEMEGLKLKHISTRAELNRFEQDNISQAIQWFSTSRKKDILTEKFIKDLHQRMFGNVWRWAGSLRRSNKNIGADSLQISVQLHTLLKDTQYWIENNTYSADEIAVRFHHRLVSIHLFANGNGRHARLMTDIILQDLLKKEPLSWDIESIVDKNHVRNLYLTALREADKGDYLKLLEFVRHSRP